MESNFKIKISSLEYKLAKHKHDAMLELYRTQQWKEAALKCNELIGEFDGKMDGYYAMMIERIRQYEMERVLPKNWDGIYVSLTK